MTYRHAILYYIGPRPDSVSFSTAIAACEADGQWEANI